MIIGALIAFGAWLVSTIASAVVLIAVCYVLWRLWAWYVIRKIDKELNES